MLLPAVFSILLVLLMLILSLTTTSTSALRQTNYYVQDDHALYAADAGLSRALAEFQANGDFSETSGQGNTVFSGTVEATGASYTVNVYSNDGQTPMSVPGGALIPPNCALLVSEGRSTATRSTRRSAALVQKGLGTVQVGSLANNITAENSVFNAYDSRREAAGYSGSGVDPNSLVTQQAVIATNKSTGTPVKLSDTEVKGNIMLGPGSDPNSQVQKTGTSTTGQVGVLQEKIEIPPIDVPALPNTGADGDPPTPALYKPTTSSEHVSITRDANGNITIINQCFKCVIEPNGNFSVSEDSYDGSGAKSASGNLLTGEVSHQTASKFSININANSISIGGAWHGIVIDSNASRITVDPPTNGSGDTWISGSREEYPAPAWLLDSVFANIPPDEVNPSELDTGFFGNVTIDAGKTKLKDSSTLVIKNLEIKGGGQLNLPKNGKDVTIYVTDSLSVSGLDAILNETRSAPELKIYYTGTKPVQMSGGSSSFLTLFAPNAEIHLNGEGSTFFGALATNKDLFLKDAEFYYDVATDGVGTGTDGTTMKVLTHQRL